MPNNNRKNNTDAGEPATLQSELRPPSTLRHPGNSLPEPRFSAHPVLALLASFCIVTVFAASVSAIEQQKNAVNAKRSLAVLNIESVSGRDQDTAALLTDTIRNEIARTTPYSVMEQNSMIALLEEHRFPLLHCSAQKCAIEAGQLLGVQTVVIGAITKIGETRYLTLSRVNVMKRIKEFTVVDKGRIGEKELLLAGAQMAHKLTGEFAVTSPGSTAPENERFDFRVLTAFDKELATVWLRDADKARKSMTWEEANEYIQRLNKEGYAGYGDWRLPDKNELATLIAYMKGQGKNNNIHDLLKNAGFKNMKADYYWSATLTEDGSGLAWVLDMYGGEISSAAKSNSCYVWPVRTGPWLFEERLGTP